MAKYAVIISWIGGAVFAYIYVMRVGSLRDEGKGWIDALVKENDMVFFGAVGFATMLAMLLASPGN